jgi:hypothetical protein
MLNIASMWALFNWLIRLTNSLCSVAQILDKKISGHIQYGPPLLNLSMGNLRQDPYKLTTNKGIKI